MSNEIWKDIEGYEGLYQVSNLGKVKSIDRVIIRKNQIVHRKGKILEPYKDKAGYLSIGLYKNGKGTT